MSTLYITHLIAGMIVIAISIPLILRKVTMNPWYGIRIPAAFRSESQWYEINRYGGKVMLWWGIAVLLTGATGLLAKLAMTPYLWISNIVILGGLLVVIGLIFKYAAKVDKS